MTVLATDHAMLLEAVREAGALAFSFFRKDPRTWKKAAGDPVSEADIAVDVLLRDRLHGPRPDYGWLSEECEDDPVRLDHRRIWIVDPIDGTRAFLEERPNHKKGFQRLKGLGEMDWDELRTTTMLDGTRTLLQVNVEEAALADEITSILMGDDVPARRGFITTNARDVRNLDF